MLNLSSSVRFCASPNRWANSPRRGISFRSLTSVRERLRLDIESAEHGCCGFVELFGSTDILEPVEEICCVNTLFIGPIDVVHHASTMLHDQPIAECGGL